MDVTCSELSNQPDRLVVGRLSGDHTGAPGLSLKPRCALSGPTGEGMTDRTKHVMHNQQLQSSYSSAGPNTILAYSSLSVPD